MDGRRALTPGTTLHFFNRNGGEVRYTIRNEIGRGGSCLVYDASYEDSIGNRKLIRIKECYPYGLKIHRTDGGDLSPEEGDAAAFAISRERMKAAYRKTHELFQRQELTNAIANTADLYEAYGTTWIVSTWLNGATLRDKPPRTMRECAALMLATARILERIHEAGYLYLDLKPENIMTIHGVTELIQLFDFDSLIAAEELAAARETGDPSALRTSFTRGYASPEQQTGKIGQIGPWSDVYSLGAVLFELLWGHAPTAFDGEADAVYDYETFVYSGSAFQDGLYRELSDFFHHSLASYIKDRYQQMGEAVAQLQEIALLADEQRPYLVSAAPRTNPAFYGREEEMAALRGLLAGDSPVAALTGMGGIGKSTLAREYLRKYRDQYDAALYLYDSGSIDKILADDQHVCVNTVWRAPEESEAEYAFRKMEILKRLCATRKVLLILDQFSPDHWNDLQPLFSIGWKVLLISRERLPEGLCPSLRIEEMGRNALGALFLHYSHLGEMSPEDRAAFSKMADAVYGHTLTIELIARQIRKSHLTMKEAAETVASAGFDALPGEKIDYLRDLQSERLPLIQILNRLMNVDSFTEDDRLLIRELALFDLPGIDASLLREMTGRAELNHLNDLEEAGWVISDGNKLALHPLMQEVVRSWPWNRDMEFAAEGMAERLYQRLKPKGARHDTDRQSPSDYARLYELLCAADQLQAHCRKTTLAGQRLRYRILMDAPVDQDERTAERMAELLNHPEGLDEGSVLRLYESSAFLFGRLEQYEKAFDQLERMKAYLIRHPSAFYASLYHRAMAVMIHNEGRKNHVKRSLRHEDQAIAAARVSRHPDAKKQLAASLTDKATTLLDAGEDPTQCRRLLAEAERLVDQHTDDSDYERYQFYCVSAMYYAVCGRREESIGQLKKADRIAFERQDSPLAYIEHRLDQEAPIRLAFNDDENAIEILEWAAEECAERDEIAAYRRTRFSAWYTLKRVYEERGDALRADEMDRKMKKHREDSPWPMADAEPLAQAERNKVDIKNDKPVY